jgi:hypothetical protein
MGKAGGKKIGAAVSHISPYQKKYNKIK